MACGGPCQATTSRLLFGWSMTNLMYISACVYWLPNEYQFRRYGHHVLAFLNSSADMALNGLAGRLDGALWAGHCQQSFSDKAKQCHARWSTWLIIDEHALQTHEYSCMDSWFIIICGGLDPCLREFLPVWWSNFYLNIVWLVFPSRRFEPAITTRSVFEISSP